MKHFGLYKKQKLCSATAIDILFGSGGAEFSRIAYPLRAVARRNDKRRSDAPLTFLISVPKKRLRHAVDRVKMRRRVREAFRLTHQTYPLPDGTQVDIAFIYVANDLAPYAAVARSMSRILEALQDFYATDHS